MTEPKVHPKCKECVYCDRDYCGKEPQLLYRGSETPACKEYIGKAKESEVSNEAR